MSTPTSIAPLRGLPARWQVPGPALLAVLGLIALWCALRFWHLDTSPAGFFMDESRGALHIMCLAEGGQSADGESWPLFASGFAGGFYTPPYLYFGLLWTRVFGTSPAAFRAMAAFFTLVTLAGLYLLVRRVVNPRAALLALLAGALSPWSWQFSRIAWDPPLAPAFLIWGTLLFCAAPSRWRLAVAGILLSLSMYAYPPLRVTAPLWLLTLTATARLVAKIPLRQVVPCFATFALVSIPLAMRMLTGDFLKRSATVSITSVEFLDQHRDELPRAVYFLEALLENLFAHIRPGFLLFRGDSNLRHSTQLVGQIGPLDALALGIALFFVLRLAWRQYIVPAQPETGPASGVHARSARVAFLAVVGAILAVLPAALTWEGVPHALRAIATWAFVAAFTGIVLDRVLTRTRWRWWAVLAVALSYSALFLPAYFPRYDRVDDEWFHRQLAQTMGRSDLTAEAAAAQVIGRYPDWEIRYFLMRRGKRCGESLQVLENLRD